MEWVMSYHEGAIRYYKEVGQWSPELQEHAETLLAREKVIQDAWKAHGKTGSEGAEFDKGWMKARADDLETAGLNPRSEEQTSELQSLMRISYAVFCLKTKTNNDNEAIT